MHTYNKHTLVHTNPFEQCRPMNVDHPSAKWLNKILFMPAICVCRILKSDNI